jgi:hypothetical protein
VLLSRLSRSWTLAPFLRFRGGLSSTYRPSRNSYDGGDSLCPPGPTGTIRKCKCRGNCCSSSTALLELSLWLLLLLLLLCRHSNTARTSSSFSLLSVAIFPLFCASLQQRSQPILPPRKR